MIKFKIILVYLNFYYCLNLYNEYLYRIILIRIWILGSCVKKWCDVYVGRFILLLDNIVSYGFLRLIIFVWFLS